MDLYGDLLGDEPVPKAENKSGIILFCVCLFQKQIPMIKCFHETNIQI